MKVGIIGAGPAGLYLSILLKKRFPATAITVYERNGPDETFGFGVVFSDATLDTFERYDIETYRAITQAFAYWDDIEINVRGETHRVGGNGFCGCARRTLLLILQERAADLRRRPPLPHRNRRRKPARRLRSRRRRRRNQQPLPRAERRLFRNARRSAAEQVRVDGLDQAARRLHLRLRTDRMGAVHRPRLSVRGGPLDLDLRNRSRHLPSRRP